MANDLNPGSPLEVKYGLPARVVFCKKCVISNQRPTTTLEFKNNPSQAKPTTAFNEEGICDACVWAEKKEKEIDWAARNHELEQLLDRFRSKDGSYDVVVPGSGGKDSAYAAHLLKEHYGMHPLTVTWAPHIYTDIGWRNLQAFIHSGFDNILVTPNGRVHRLLTKLAFLNLGHPFQPFILGQRNIGPKMALQHNVKLVFYGENVAEYGNNWRDNLSPLMNETLFTGIDINNENLFIGGVTIKELLGEHGLDKNDLLPYASVDRNACRKAGIEMHYMSYYKKWIPQENYYYAAEHTGFKPNVERTQGTYSKYSSIDDKTDPFHYFMTLIKFGIGRTTYDAAQEIRTGHITREEGVALVRRYDAEFPDKYFKEFLEYIDITEGEFWKAVDGFRSPHLWKKDANGVWELRHQVE
ncbi:MAG: N-acetyl sugar amidotransferase [Sulfuricellaceae bacterium]|nr:N-acetyl sugar amidotransferase [Sulfuricellaceae bacterium]